MLFFRDEHLDGLGSHRKILIMLWNIIVRGLISDPIKQIN